MGWKRVFRSLIGATMATVCSATLLLGCGSSKAKTAAATTTTSAAGPSTAGVISAPILLAQTADGAIGYRELGRGMPIVLIMGFGGTMDDWAPTFVNALAVNHHVVLLDNAGVGMTANVASPLTITAMADQTSALITTLRLGRTDVLGWSMGGMIAQSLAVRHPAQVRRLVLAATQPGTGASLPVPAAAAAALLSPNLLTKLGVLFPPDQAPAERAYVDGVAAYPDRYDASPAVEAVQSTALEQWIAGVDPSGRRIATLRLPTLVADGTVDQLDPMANDQYLAATIAGAQLVLYPDAGHAFLFQDAATFVPRLALFLR